MLRANLLASQSTALKTPQYRLHEELDDDADVPLRENADNSHEHDAALLSRQNNGSCGDLDHDQTSMGAGESHGGIVTANNNTVDIDGDLGSGAGGNVDGTGVGCWM